MVGQGTTPEVAPLVDGTAEIVTSRFDFGDSVLVVVDIDIVGVGAKGRVATV